MSLAGSIAAVVLDGRRYPVASDEDANIDMGGRSKSYEPNGDNTARSVRRSKTWSATNLALSIEDVSAWQTLQELQNRNDDFPVSIELATGDVVSGDGGIVGDRLELNTGNSTVNASFEGPGTLETA